MTGGGGGGEVGEGGVGGMLKGEEAGAKDVVFKVVLVFGRGLL